MQLLQKMRKKIRLGHEHTFFCLVEPSLTVTTGKFKISHAKPYFIRDGGVVNLCNTKVYSLAGVGLEPTTSGL